MFASASILSTLRHNSIICISQSTLMTICVIYNISFFHTDECCFFCL